MPGRLFLDSKSSASANMAIDESLLRHAQAPVLRLYGWEETCVSIGYFQKASVVPAGISFVRRYTGGGLVEHGRDLTYTLVPFAGAFFMGIYFGSIILLTGIQPISNRLRKKGVDPVLVEKYEMRAFYAVVATIAVLTLAALVKTYLLSESLS